jgi:glycosyltransferase involved in cell wall biosynthesis
MKIVIEARALSAKGGGVKHYVEELIRQIATDELHHLTVLSSHSRVRVPASAAVETVPLHHEVLVPWWLTRSVPRALRRLQPDVVHFTKSDVPAPKRFPTVVTIYDVIPLLFPGSQEIMRRWYWPWALQRAAQQSDHILTISEASKRDITEHLQVDPAKITVTPLAIDVTRFKAARSQAIRSLRQHFQILSPYILFVGTIEPRKNVPLLLRAFERIAKDIPHTLIVAGKKGYHAPPLAALIKASPYQARIRWLDFVAGDELPTLYSGADLFVWPSVYEGWGFPPLESMACGVPVVVSNGGSLPEVVGGAGEIVPFTLSPLNERLHDHEFEIALADRMLTVLQNKERRTELAHLGAAQVRRFTWQAVADKTMAVYEQVGEGI